MLIKRKKRRLVLCSEEVQEEEGAKKSEVGTRRKLKAKGESMALVSQEKMMHLKYACMISDEDKEKMVIREFFRTLMGVLSILDREDLKVIYELVMEEYKDRLPEGFDRMLWGDLMIMFNQGDTADFWDTQQDWRLSAGNYIVPRSYILS
ncbi:hypothetical protein Tco_1228971 [Tanacetum coccineum]